MQCLRFHLMQAWHLHSSCPLKDEAQASTIREMCIFFQTLGVRVLPLMGGWGGTRRIS